MRRTVAGARTRAMASTNAAMVSALAGIPAATDENSGDTLTYSMEGTDAAAFAGARVTPSNAMTAGLTPACRALIARDLIRRGESVHAIGVEAGAVRLAPVGSWDVRGGPDERAWWYRVDVFGPSGNLTHFVPSGSVIHARYAVDAARPWYGIGPLGWARSTGTLAANLETRLGEEAGGPVGHLLPIPADGGDGSDDDPTKMLKADLAAGKGRTMLVETTSAGFGEGRMAAPSEDWKPRHFGASPPDSLPTLRTDAALAVLAACQVPAALFTDADGTSQRESWRRRAMGPLAGLAATVEVELAAKLDQPVRLDFSGLWAHDLSGRASAFKSFVAGGMALDKAAGLAGLMDSD